MWSQLIRFGMVGSLGFGVNLAVFAMASTAFGFEPNLAAVVAFAVAVTGNYSLNRVWSFALPASERVPYVAGWARYVAINAFGLGVNVAVLNSVLGWFGRDFMYHGQAVGVACGMLFNFFLSRALIFGRVRAGASELE
jgi:putative flippase GtrA